jgi:hypothetical protein
MPCRAKFMLHLGASRRSCLPRVARTASSFTAVSLAPAALHLASRPGAAGGFRARAWQVRRLIAVVRGSSPTPGSSLTLPCALIVSSLGEGLDFFNSAGFSPIHTCDSLLHRGSHVIQLWLNEGPCLVHSIMHRLYLLSQLRQSWLTSANAIPA